MIKTIIAFSVLFFGGGRSTPLDDYVNAYDSHYNYSLIKTYVMTGYKLFILNMTSQKWYDGNKLKS